MPSLHFFLQYPPYNFVTFGGKAASPGHSASPLPAGTKYRIFPAVREMPVSTSFHKNQQLFSQHFYVLFCRIINIISARNGNYIQLSTMSTEFSTPIFPFLSNGFSTYPHLCPQTAIPSSRFPVFSVLGNIITAFPRPEPLRRPTFKKGTGLMRQPRPISRLA